VCSGGQREIDSWEGEGKENSGRGRKRVERAKVRGVWGCGIAGV